MYSWLRKSGRKLILDIISLSSEPKPGIHILNGHFLSLDDHLSNNTFYNQLKSLLFHGVDYLNIEKAVEYIENKRIPSDKCYVAFTFDDGFEECFTKIRPVLNNFGIKAGFFINPNFIDGNEEYQRNFKNNIVYTNKQPMNRDQIMILVEEGHVIGAHTMDHIKLDIDNRDILEYQIGESKKYIEDKFKTNCDYFAFPYGRIEHINDMGVEIARKYFKYVFSQSNYKCYYSFEGKVINRRHFECDWPYRHVLYFLKEKTLTC
ncbi:MAG: hypothetical protein AMS27_09125 [Bacteroides sp. SM23_62_1]|nr:MAG: hypothetical protein AMS27_09125 [Bacteroides sp. SM23_62_1]